MAGCDAVVTSGGVSMGDYDVVKAVLSRIADMRWMQIAIKPAKPFAFGLLDGVPVFGLPGNPVSSFVSFELFARPALRQMMGIPQIDRTSVAAVADDALVRRADGKVHYARVIATPGDDGLMHVRPVAAQGSHRQRTGRAPRRRRRGRWRARPDHAAVTGPPGPARPTRPGPDRPGAAARRLAWRYGSGRPVRAHHP